jgi:hypothetical protein
MYQLDKERKIETVKCRKGVRWIKIGMYKSEEAQ